MTPPLPGRASGLVDCLLSYRHEEPVLSVSSPPSPSCGFLWNPLGREGSVQLVGAGARDFISASLMVGE